MWWGLGSDQLVNLFILTISLLIDESQIAGDAACHLLTQVVRIATDPSPAM